MGAASIRLYHPFIALWIAELSRFLLSHCLVSGCDWWEKEKSSGGSGNKKRVQP